jgi:hypothetical protein
MSFLQNEATNNDARGYRDGASIEDACVVSDAFNGLTQRRWRRDFD